MYVWLIIYYSLYFLIETININLKKKKKVYNHINNTNNTIYI